jgi:macrolide transport system ATP-binding/permease protein
VTGRIHARRVWIKAAGNRGFSFFDPEAPVNDSFLTFRDVSFTYQSSPIPLFEHLEVSFPRGWTGIVGANGTGKTTLLRLAVMDLAPSAGGVELPGQALYCAQRTDEPPALFDAFLTADDGEACRLQGRLGILEDWRLRWRTLSHGERKRCQIAVSLWRMPDVLAIDEPTNHIDSEARTLLMRAMRSYRGVGLLVSHDRELLDGLCGRCLFLEPSPARPSLHPGRQAIMRRGGYSEASAEIAEERRQSRERYEKARAAVKELEKAAAEKKREAAGTRRRLSKRGIAKRDQDAKSRIDAARITGKDAISAKKLREVSGRLSRAESEAEGMAVAKLRDLGLWFSSRQARKDALFHLPASRLPLGGGGSLSLPELVMYPSDRIGLTGPNGAGKSTFIRRLMEMMNECEERILYLPQEIDLDASLRIMEGVRSLPGAERGRVMTVVNLLGTDPERLLATQEPSPGELRKVLIAGGIARTPELIVMDEPTNHLDLPSIECLTRALAQCACGVLLVSHDMRFLDDVTTIRWRITPAGGRAFSLGL